MVVSLEVTIELYISKNAPSRNKTPSASPFEEGFVPASWSTFEVTQVMLESLSSVVGVELSERPAPVLSASMQRLLPDVCSTMAYCMLPTYPSE
jgi:hypothetical protein